MKQQCVTLRGVGRSEALSLRKTERLPLRPRCPRNTDHVHSGMASGSSDTTATRCRSRAGKKSCKRLRGLRRIHFDQKTIENTEKNHRQECSLRGPHPQCDLWVLPPIEPCSLEEPPHRSRVTFCRKVLVKPIAHHADIKRRGGEWETLRESLDREDEYFLLLNDEEPEEGEDLCMSGQHSPAEGDYEDQLEGQQEVKTEIYCDEQEDNETAEPPPNDVVANDLGIEMLKNQLESECIFENGNEIMQNASGIVLGVFVNGSTEGCVAPWSPEPEETQGARDFGIRLRCGMVLSGEQDEEDLFEEEGEDESLFEGDWEATCTDTDDSDEMMTTRAVAASVHSLVVKSNESLPNTTQLEREISDQDGPFFEEKDEDQRLSVREGWEATNRDDNSHKIPVVANPPLMLEGPVFTNLELLPDIAQLEGEISDQTQLTTKALPPSVTEIQERKRKSPFDITTSTFNHAQSRAPSWVIKRRKIYPDICNRYQQRLVHR